MAGRRAAPHRNTTWRRIAAAGGRTLSRGYYFALHRDTLGDPARSVVVAGTARSGTTWLGEVIASQLPACRVMFEPFHPHKVRAYRRYAYFQYMRPEHESVPMLEFCQRVFSGRIRHPWIDRELTELRPQSRLIKDVRANLLLGWIAPRFPQLPLVLILRHPCAVVLSRLQLGWATDSDLASFLAQPDLIEDFLADRLDLIRATRTDAGKHALIWCISNLVPLRHLNTDRLHVVFYERLRDHPTTEIPSLFAAIRRPYRDSVFDSLRTPSSTARGMSRPGGSTDRAEPWQVELSTAQINEVLAIVDAFGLSHLYGESTHPRATAIEAPTVPK